MWCFRICSSFCKDELASWKKGFTYRLSPKKFIRSSFSFALLLCLIIYDLLKHYVFFFFFLKALCCYCRNAITRITSVEKFTVSYCDFLGRGYGMGYLN